MIRPPKEESDCPMITENNEKQSDIDQAFGLCHEDGAYFCEACGRYNLAMILLSSLLYGNVFLFFKVVFFELFVFVDFVSRFGTQSFSEIRGIKKSEGGLSFLTYSPPLAAPVSVLVSEPEPAPASESEPEPVRVASADTNKEELGLFDVEPGLDKKDEEEKTEDFKDISRVVFPGTIGSDVQVIYRSPSEGKMAAHLPFQSEPAPGSKSIKCGHSTSDSPISRVLIECMGICHTCFKEKDRATQNMILLELMDEISQSTEEPEKKDKVLDVVSALW